METYMLCYHGIASRLDTLPKLSTLVINNCTNAMQYS